MRQTSFSRAAGTFGRHNVSFVSVTQSLNTGTSMGRLVLNVLPMRQIFQLYVENEALLSVVAELDCRGWRTKCWTTKKGVRRGGRPFDKNSLYQLLANVIYLGKVRYKREIHEGEHEAIVDAEVFDRVQALLQQNGRTGGRARRNNYGALLRCAACDCGMNHTYTAKGTRRSNGSSSMKSSASASTRW